MSARRPLRPFVERLLAILALAAAMLVLWTLRDLLIVLFGALVTAVLLKVVAEPIERLTGLGKRAALALAIAALLTSAATLGYLFGVQFGAQFSELARDIPRGWQDARGAIEALPFGRGLIDTIGAAALDETTLAGRIADLVLKVGNVLLDFGLIVVGAIFFAAQPDLYRNGFLKLLPADWRGPVGSALGDCGGALRLWLRGQLISILLVGLLTWVGLALVGVPGAFALATIAACAEVVPYVGPIASAIPGILIGIAAGPETALLTALVYLLVQQVEGNIIQPLVQRRVVTLPPAVTLFGVVASGLLFGFIGILFAAPAAVVVYVLVKRLYVRELLHTPTSVPGEPV